MTCLLGLLVLVWVFQNLLIYWDFPTQTSPGFTENGQKKTKYPVNSLGDNVLLKSQVRGKWPASSSLEGNIQSSNHSLQPGYAEEYLWTHMSFSSIRPHWVPLHTEATGYSLHWFTKTGQEKFGKMLPGLMSLEFCCIIWTVSIIRNYMSMSTIWTL